MLFNQAKAEEIAEGQAAPDFTLVDQAGHTHSLSDYSGRWVVLYFIQRMTRPVALSRHARFETNFRSWWQKTCKCLESVSMIRLAMQNLRKNIVCLFPLLADAEGKVAKRYQALTSLGPLKFAKRHTFLIDPQGAIQKIYRKVDVDNHSQRILQDLQALKS